MENIEKVNDRLPVVMVGEKLVDNNGRYIQNLFKIMNISDESDINEVIRVIFSKLGSDENDTIVIEDVLKNAWDMVELQFKINDEKTWYIKFHNRFGRNCVGVAITDDVKNWYSYYCKILKGNVSLDSDVKEKNETTGDIDVSMRLKKYTLGLGTGNVKDFISCEKGHQGVLYWFGSPVSKDGKNDQMIYFKINCPDEMAKKNLDNETYYSPENEKELIDYLSNVSFPVKIDRVYSDILNLCFDGSVPKYPLFDLHVVMSKQQKGEEERIVTDSVILVDGKLKTFGMMHNGSVEGCSMKNVGATVEFIGNHWMNYHAFVLKNGYASLRVQGIDEEDSLIDINLVRDTACKMIEMFPDDASRMLGEKYYSSCIESSLEGDGLSSVVERPKQYKK